MHSILSDSEAILKQVACLPNRLPKPGSYQSNVKKILLIFFFTLNLGWSRSICNTDKAEFNIQMTSVNMAHPACKRKRQSQPVLY
jgi:hypothetical protein